MIIIVRNMLFCDTLVKSIVRHYIVIENRGFFLKGMNMDQGSKIFDELGKLMNEAAGVADGMRREVETMVKSQMERLVADLDLVKREDFDVLRELVQIQGEEIQALRKDLDNFKKKKKA